MAVELTESDDESNDTVTAASKVFGTYELLEQILLHLPCRDVLSARNVSKQSRGVFVTSTSLQKGCFLKPIADTLPFAGIWLVRTNHSFNMHDATRLWRKQRCAPSKTMTLDASASDITSSTMLLNFFDDGTHVLNPLAEVAIRLRHMSYPAQYGTASPANQKTKPTSEWRKMYLTQPPTSTVQLRRTLFLDTTILTQPAIYCIQNVGGVTVGDLLKCVKRFEVDPKNRLVSSNVLFAGVVELEDEAISGGEGEERQHVCLYR